MPRSDDSDCMLCGCNERSHHEFAKRLPACKCEPWDCADEYTAICKSFVPTSGDLSRCRTCEHDLGCHAPKAEPTPE